MWEKDFCRQQGQWRRRGRMWSRHQSRDSLATHGEDHDEAGCPPEAHEGLWWSVNPAADHGGPHARAGGCAWRRLWHYGEPLLEQDPGMTCGPMRRGAHTWAGLLAGLVILCGIHAGTVCSWRTAPHRRDLWWSRLWTTAARGKHTHQRSSCRTFSHRWDLMLEQGKSMSPPPPENKGVAERTCDEPTATPIPCPLAPPGWRKWRKWGVNLSLGRRER